MKKLLIIATGGTIASVSTAAGLTPNISGEDLVANVPLINELCAFDFIQPMNIDSTNMRLRDWIHLCRDIIENYDNYDGFVILHGTDTMAYTAAALSYLIQNSPKPIVLTGSQQPMANPFTDAKLNLYHSVLYAIDEKSCGVVVVFGNEVIAGTRAHKQRTLSFNAFTSMNFPALAHIRGNRIIRSYTGADAGVICLDEKVGPHDSRTHTSLQTYTKLNERVIVLKLTPELNPSIFYLLKRDYDAIVLETFGIGGIPDHDGEYEKAINDWISSGRIIVVTTQVPEEGLDLGVYQVGSTYAHKDGILAGDDMSTEALVAKTMWILGQTHDQREISELFYRVVFYDRVPNQRADSPKEQDTSFPAPQDAKAL